MLSLTQQTNQKTMNATIHISKIITVVNSTMVYNIKSSEFCAEVNKYDSVILKGWFSVAKYNKYVEILNNNNFNESVIYYKDINEDNSIDFRIKFEKQ